MSEDDTFIRFGDQRKVEVPLSDIRNKLRLFHALEVVTAAEGRFLRFCKDTAIDNPGGVVAMYLKDHGIEY